MLRVNRAVEKALAGRHIALQQNRSVWTWNRRALFVYRRT